MVSEGQGTEAMDNRTHPEVGRSLPGSAPYLGALSWAGRQLQSLDGASESV